MLDRRPPKQQQLSRKVIRQEEDEEVLYPVEQRERRQVLLQLVAAEQHYAAVKEIASLVLARLYVPIPLKTDEQRAQYTEYKVACDMFEQMFLEIEQEAQLAQQEESAEHNVDFEEDDGWTSMRMKQAGRTFR